MSPKNTGNGSRIVGELRGPFQDAKNRGGSFGKQGRHTTLDTVFLAGWVTAILENYDNAITDPTEDPS